MRLALPKLCAQHPLLLFELAHDADQDVLRGEICVGETVHPTPRPLADFGDSMRQLTHDRVILDRSARDRCQLRSSRYGLRLPVGDEAECDGPFGDGVGKSVPGVDQFVELQMKRPKQSALG